MLGGGSSLCVGWRCGAAVPPTVESALDGSYPISRPLYLYTLGEPSGAILEFVRWIQGDEGQKVVEREGYVPNVVYSCGALVHNRELIIPYAMSDYASTFATVSLDEVLAHMKMTG